MKVVWAHLGLSKELRDLHPAVHVHILRTLFAKHPNLHADVSWDVLAKMVMMNFDQESTPVTRLLASEHIDLHANASHTFDKDEIREARKALHDVWEENKELVTNTSSGAIKGPTFRLAMYLQVFEDYKDRFVTGTDFVSSFGSPKEYPGMLGANARGCVKDKVLHSGTGLVSVNCCVFRPTLLAS